METTDKPDVAPGQVPAEGSDTIEITGLSTRLSILIILLVVAALILPIAFMGIPDGYDLMQHVRFAASYHDAIVSGEIMPKWAGGDNFGFGSIGIRYYPPLAYCGLALTRIVTGSWYDSFWITSFFWMALGSFGVYAWLKEWTTNTLATAAAIAYAIVPYHTFQIYQAVLYSEFAASGILPFCFLFLTRVCNRRRWIDAVLFSVAYSSLILTHIPSAIIATISLAVYGLVIVDWKKFVDTALKLGAAFVLTGLSVAFHLAKAMPEIEWVKHNSPQFFASGYYDYKTYLFPIYFSATWTKYVEKMLWHYDSIVLLTLLFLLATLAAYLFTKKETGIRAIGSKLVPAVMITGGFALVMLSVTSTTIWHSISFLQKIQFPWRWLSVASLMGAAGFAFALPFLVVKGRTISRLRGYAVVAFVLIILLDDVSQNLIPSVPLSREIFGQKIEKMYDEEACDCWWPIWAQREAFDRRTQADAGERKTTIIEWQDASRKIDVAPGTTPEMRLATFYHPYWKATVNGAETPVGRSNDGSIVVPLPAGAVSVAINFTEPRFLMPVELLSLFTWIALLVYLAGYLVMRFKRPLQ